ncbi:hypothetical protein [Demequina lutea]|uniref:HNH endonuclease n=1 Tax=Demequina lutea TaxID=431489 RepID=A0A7Y9ZC18_9MICO|nr:hypothetical protein [Demequina lutea]NYI42619.1 hypothetical protein [Demequina lutea]
MSSTTSEPPTEVATDTDQIDEAAVRRYWWVSQSRNFNKVFNLGLLWTCRDRNGIWDAQREAITRLQPNDIVIHHANSTIRAVSLVTSHPWECRRPANYAARPGEGDWGLRVDLAPLRSDASMPRARFAEIIGYGPGTSTPLDKNGVAKHAYIARLDAAVARTLLRAMGVTVDAIWEPEPQGYAASGPVADPTDRAAMVKVRVEQGTLRGGLLNGRLEAPCDLCGRTLPKELLVAAHIAPRASLSDAERREFSKVAMLACVLGCDALFELGYVEVDSSGVIVEGLRPKTAAIQTATAALLGNKCGAFSSDTAAGFDSRRRERLVPLAG